MEQTKLAQVDSPVASGDVMMCRFVVTALEPEDGYFFGRFTSRRATELEAQLREATLSYLGPDFEVRSVTYRPGSIEIFAILAAGYYAVSRYKNLVESLELLYSQFKRIIEAFFNRTFPGPVTVTGSWSPGPALVNAQGRNTRAGSPGPTLVLLWYVIISHAALTAVVIWHLLRSSR